MSVRMLLHSLVSAVVSTIVVMVLAWIANMVAPNRYRNAVTVVKVILLLLIWLPIIISVVHGVIDLIPF